MHMFIHRTAARFAQRAARYGTPPADPPHDLLEPPRTITGEAMIAIDAAERVTFLNPVAETLTGWSGHDAVGRPVGEVLEVVDEITRIPIIGALVSLAGKEQFSRFAQRALLVARDERE
jgi:PAS domain-containing protein